VIKCIQLLGGHCPVKIWESKKRSKISAIYDNSHLWPHWMQLSTSGKRHCHLRSFLRGTKTIWWLTPEVTWLTFTHPNSALRVLHMLMHWSLGHVALLAGEFPSPELFPQLDLRCRADARWALPQLSSLSSFYIWLAFAVAFSGTVSICCSVFSQQTNCRGNCLDLCSLLSRYFNLSLFKKIPKLVFEGHTVSEFDQQW